MSKWMNAWSKYPTPASSLHCFTSWLSEFSSSHYMCVEPRRCLSPVVGPRDGVVDKADSVWALTEPISRCQRQMPSNYHRVINDIEGEELGDMEIYLFLGHLVPKITFMLICVFQLQFWVPSTVPKFIQPLTLSKYSVNELNGAKRMLKILRLYWDNWDKSVDFYPLEN